MYYIITSFKDQGITLTNNEEDTRWSIEYTEELINHPDNIGTWCLRITFKTLNDLIIAKLLLN
jgi:hypothetical protein